MSRNGWMLAGGAGCLVVAIALAFLADDIRRWPAALRAGDVQARIAPGRPEPWGRPRRFPFHTAERILGVDDDLELRRALRYFLLSRPRMRRRFGFGFHPPVEAARRRFRAIERGHGDPAKRSAAANFLGVMAYEAGGYVDPAFVGQALREFLAAVRLDPTNEQAKSNLELLLERMRDQQETDGGGGGAGRATLDVEGASSTPPGAGY